MLIKLWELRKGAHFLYNDVEGIKKTPRDEYQLCETSLGQLSGHTDVEIFERGAPALKGARIMGVSKRRVAKYRRKVKAKPVTPANICAAIMNGCLTKCCNTGCVSCDFRGWTGRISRKEENFSYQKTKQYALYNGISYKTVQRYCDGGKLCCFRVNKLRYIMKKTCVSLDKSSEM